MSIETWNLIAAGIGQPRFTFTDLMSAIGRFVETGSALPTATQPDDTEPYTNTLFDIAHDIALTDDELAEREEWVQDLMSRPEIEDEQFERDLDNWESNR